MNYDIETIKKELEVEFPDLSFTIGKRIYGKCIIAKKSKYNGADIFVKKDVVIIEAAIPEMKTRILIGGGALLLKIFSKNFNEPSKRIAYFLRESYTTKLNA